MLKHRDKQNSKIADEAIIELYWSRNESAIRETERKYGEYLFGIAYNILHDRSDSEECRNDTYLGVWNAIPPTRPTVFPAFLTRIMRCIAINRYKEKDRKKRVPSEFTIAMEEIENTMAAFENVSEEYEAVELGKIMSDYVQKLPGRQRYIFIERFYMAEPVENIAGELDIGVSTVYRDLERIKQNLKLYLEKRGYVYE